MKKELQYNYSLQSLRGIAALVVCVGHCISTFNLPFLNKDILYLVNTHFAVTNFFVLSGYVLSASLAKGQSIKSFYVKRVFRIYPALFISCAISLLFIVIFSNARLDTGSDWINQRFREDRFGIPHIIFSFLGLSPFLLPQSWTIFLEIYASLLIPFVVRMSKFYFSLVVIILLIFGALGWHLEPHNFLMWSLDFCFGIILFKSENIRHAAMKANNPVVWALLLVYVLLSRVLFLDSFFLHLVDVMFATFIIAVLLKREFHSATWLETKPFQSLGDWSYGMYLLHFPLMYLYAHIIDIYIPLSGWLLKTTFLLFLTCFSSIIISNFLFKYIERPFIELGKSVSKNFFSNKIHNHIEI